MNKTRRTYTNANPHPLYGLNTLKYKYYGVILLGGSNLVASAFREASMTPTSIGVFGLRLGISVVRWAIYQTTRYLGINTQ